MRRFWCTVVAALLATGLLAGCGSELRQPPRATASPQAGATILHTVGTASVEPLYSEVSSVLSSHTLSVDYQLASRPRLTTGGSPAAVPVIAALGPSGRTGTGRSYVPIGFGGVAVTYDLPGVPGIRLDPRALAAIFAGQVTRWNARVIARDNPGVKLPATVITAVHLSTPSLLTRMLTEYLSRGSRSWRRSRGSGRQINWPAGTAVATEDDAAQIAEDTPGAIAYVSQVTALRSSLTTARLRNRAGSYVRLSLSALSAAGRQRLGHGLALSTITAPARDAYPLAAETYAVTFTNPCSAGLSAGERHGVTALLDYLTGRLGQTLLTQFEFAPLPARLQAAARAVIGRIGCGDSGAS